MGCYHPNFKVNHSRFIECMICHYMGIINE